MQAIRPQHTLARRLVDVHDSVKPSTKPCSQPCMVDTHQYPVVLFSALLLLYSDIVPSIRPARLDVSPTYQLETSWILHFSYKFKKVLQHTCSWGLQSRIPFSIPGSEIEESVIPGLENPAGIPGFGIPRLQSLHTATTTLKRPPEIRNWWDNRRYERLNITGKNNDFEWYFNELVENYRLQSIRFVVCSLQTQFVVCIL